MLETMMTPAEVAAYLQVSEVTLAGWRCRDKGPAYYRPARHILYRQADVDAWIESTRKEPGGHRAAIANLKNPARLAQAEPTPRPKKNYRFGRKHLKNDPDGDE